MSNIVPAPKDELVEFADRKGGFIVFTADHRIRAVAATRHARISHICPVAGIAVAALAAAPAGWADEPVVFAEATMIIEFNSTDEDVGIQFFLDAEGWKKVKIFDPKGEQIFSAAAKGSLLEQGGGTELFLESEEPTLDELSLEEFLERFPEGLYRFAGRTAEGDKLVGSAEFTHDIPAGPVIVMPAADGDECAEDVPIPVVIAWNEVTTSIDGEPLEVEGYQVIVEGEDREFSLDLPADAGTMLTVPSEFLEEGTEYDLEVLAIEESGNQTITETCFVTAE